MDNKVNVVIGGEIITLKSAEQPDYLQRLARYADQKIDEIKTKCVSAAIDDRARTLLIALNIADDYHKVLDKFQRLDSLHKRLVTETGKLQEENSYMSARLRELEAELAGTKKELAGVITALEETAEKPNVITLPPPHQRKTAR